MLVSVLCKKKTAAAVAGKSIKQDGAGGAERADRHGRGPRAAGPGEKSLGKKAFSREDRGSSTANG